MGRRGRQTGIAKPSTRVPGLAGNDPMGRFFSMTPENAIFPNLSFLFLSLTIMTAFKEAPWASV
jgi:hypothetical protein